MQQSRSVKMYKIEKESIVQPPKNNNSTISEQNKINPPALAKQFCRLHSKMDRSHLALSVAITLGPRPLVPVENTNIHVHTQNVFETVTLTSFGL